MKPWIKELYVYLTSNNLTHRWWDKNNMLIYNYQMLYIPETINVKKIQK